MAPTADGEPKHLLELEAAEQTARQNLALVCGLFGGPFAALDQLLRALSSYYSRRGEEMGPERSHAHRAQAMITARIADDVRAVWLLMERGYHAQALAAAGSALESSLLCTHIGLISGRAQRWLDWRESRTAPWSVSEMLGEAFASENREDRARLQASRRLLYTAYCCGKHVNPLLQLQVDTAGSPAGLVLRSDASISRGALLRPVSLLEHVLGAVLFLVLEHLSASPASDDQAIDQAVGRCIDENNLTVEALKDARERYA